MKSCAVCGEEKPIKQFEKYRSQQERRRNTCRQCRKSHPGHCECNRCLYKVGLRRCPRCEVVKSHDFYYTRSNGRCSSYCIQCTSEYYYERTNSWIDGKQGQPRKLCVKCDQIKFISEFNRSSSASDGHHTYCAECSRKASEKSYQLHKDDNPCDCKSCQAKRLSGTGLKRCSKCLEIKSTNSFGKRLASVDGLATQCLPCSRESLRISRARLAKVVHGPDCPCTTCTTGVKVCRRCGEEKDKSLFNSLKQSRDGLQGMCCRCQRLNILKFRYRLTECDIHRMLLQQGNSCAAGCGKAFSDLEFHVDHDHACCPDQRSCGECVRAFLCMNCNVTIGLIGEDENRAYALGDYLAKCKSLRSSQTLERF